MAANVARRNCQLAGSGWIKASIDTGHTTSTARMSGGVRDQVGERGLAHGKRIAAKVIPVQLD